MGLQDYYNTGDTGNTGVSSSYWLCQTFTPSANYNIGSVKLFLFKSGTPGTVTCYIQNTTSNKPNGSILATGTTNGDTLPTGSPYKWREITFSSPTSLSSGTKYAIVLKCSAASQACLWRYDGTSPTYSGGSYGSSNNSGVSWTMSTIVDLLFETYDVTQIYAEGTKTVTGGYSAILSTEEPDIYLEGVKTVTVEYSTSLSTETFSGDLLEGTKTVTASFGISLSSQQMIVDIGILTVTSAYTALLDTESLRDTINYPPSRPSDYDPDLIWDEDAGTWIAADGSAGSRLQTNLVAIGSNDVGQGVIYYG
jgi:hypothetical protein